MAIFSSGVKIFNIAFQDVVDNSWKAPIAPFSLQILVIWHFFSILWENTFFYNSGFNCMVKFSKYDIFYIKKCLGVGVDVIFFITLGNEVNRISTDPWKVLKSTLCTLTYRKNRKDIYNNFWLEST